MPELEVKPASTGPYVIFTGVEAAQANVVPYQADAGLTLLELARRHSVPLHWRCGLGTCGTCAVVVTVLEGVAPPISNKECNVLSREGLVPTSPTDGWRLACGYRLEGQCLRVAVSA